MSSTRIMCDLFIGGETGNAGTIRLDIICTNPCCGKFIARGPLFEAILTALDFGWKFTKSGNFYCPACRGSLDDKQGKQGRVK
jgi:hypothetical protein